MDTRGTGLSISRTDRDGKKIVEERGVFRDDANAEVSPADDEFLCRRFGDDSRLLYVCTHTLIRN